MIEENHVRRPPYRTKMVAFIFICSLIVWSLVVIIPPAPFMTYSALFTDHYSHYMSTIVAWYRGWEVYKKPIRDICTERDRSMVASVKIPRVFPSYACSYVCNIPERMNKRPLVINWPECPRAYPPGVYLYMAPEAWLYENTGISFQALNTLAILKFLAVAHLLLLLFVTVLYGKTGETGGRLSQAWMLTGIILIPLLYFLIVWWTLLGFYDALSVLFIILTFSCMIRKEWNRALFLISCAVFLHYRALWYLPLFFIIGWHILREKTWRGRNSRTWALYIISILFIAVSAAGFFMLIPLLVNYEPSNMLHMDIFSRHATAWVAKFAVRLALILALTVLLKSWRVLLLMVWQVFMIVPMPQAEPWHILFLLPLFAAARVDGAKFLQFAAVFLFFGLEAVDVFPQIPFFRDTIGFFVSCFS